MKKRRERTSKPFLQRMRFKYRISFIDENTLEEAWHIRLSRLSLFLYTCVFILITFVLLTALIFTTPIRYYLPGYGDDDNREFVINESMRADSLEQQLNLQGKYLGVIKDIISGNVKAENVESLDSFAVAEKRNILAVTEKSDLEKKFIEKFEDEEKFNLLTLDSKTNENAFVFFRPTRGLIAEKYNASAHHYGILINTSVNENVLSVLDGTVVYADYSFEWGWVIQVQHESNYLSIYKNNTRLLKKVGDNVRAGEIIAMTGDAKDKKKYFYFELWNQGNAMNPEDLIIF